MRAMRRAGGTRRVLGMVAVFVAIVSLLGTVYTGPATAATVIETAYKATGSWAVSTVNVTDTGGRTYVVHYPTNMGQGGVDHVILTWGNGTNAAPSQYTGILNHLASWGFVVVASTVPRTGTGTEMLAGVNYLISQNGNPSSIFYQDLVTNKAGALGHSQGASGALNATTASNGLITSTLPLHLPNPGWIDDEHETDFSKIVNPVFFVTGTSDWFISTASAQTTYYNTVAGKAAKASLKGAGHNAVQGAATNYKGYVTAWFMYTLRGDTTARGAFVGSPPELNTNTNWQNQATKTLP